MKIKSIYNIVCNKIVEKAQETRYGKLNRFIEIIFLDPYYSPQMFDFNQQLRNDTATVASKYDLKKSVISSKFKLTSLNSLVIGHFKGSICSEPHRISVKLLKYCNWPLYLLVTPNPQWQKHTYLRWRRRWSVCHYIC